MPRARIYKRPDSSYFWAEFSLPDGTPARQSTGCRTRREAQEWLSARIEERKKAALGIPVAVRQPLDLALAEYLELREKEWALGWYKTVEGFFRLQVVPHFGAGFPLCDVTRPMVERFRATQIGRRSLVGKKKRPISPTTVNRMMAALAAFGAWAAEPDRAYLLSNPFAGHDPLPEDDTPPPAITPAQYERWLSHLPVRSRGRGRPFTRALVTFAVETGLRRGELGRLRWDDIDLAGRRLWVVSSYSRGLTKGRRSRPQSLTARAVAVLETLPRRIDGFVFGKVPDVAKAMKTAALKAGIPDVWMHACRHFGASLVGALGASDGDLQAWGGWSSPKMVRRYDHSGLARLDAIARRQDERRGHGLGSNGQTSQGEQPPVGQGGTAPADAGTA